jgi:UDP-GlcNAc:undecaprenyl-phosphate GlcNAc-1-phosphate transferase
MAVASQLGAFHAVFSGNSAPLGVVLAASVIFGVGLSDDLREMSPPAKLAGQVLAGTVLYFFNVSMVFFHVPLAQTTLVLSPDFAALATVLWVAVMANAVNFIDGLDGLAAGIVAIGAAAFFVYAHQLGEPTVGNIAPGNSGPLIAVIAVGICVGFLPHNFYPARIFMGDAGAMLLGLLMAASTLAVVGQDNYQFSGRTYFLFAPIIIPFFIMGIPLFDTAFAIVRRAGQRTSPAVRDINHLHHRLMRLGHGHRPAVIILWAWTALLSGIVLWPGVTNSHNEIPPIAVGALSILLYTLFAPRGRAPAGTEGQRNGNGRGHFGGNGAPSPNGLGAGGRTAPAGAGRARAGGVRVRRLGAGGMSAQQAGAQQAGAQQAGAQQAGPEQAGARQAGPEHAAAQQAGVSLRGLGSPDHTPQAGGARPGRRGPAPLKE